MVWIIEIENTDLTEIHHSWAIAFDREKVSKLIMWMVSTALQSYSMQPSLLKKTDFHFTILSEEEQYEESLVSKILRWITASVIVGKISLKVYKINTSTSPGIKTLQSLLECIKNGYGERRENNYGNKKALVATILYLQQLLGLNGEVLPSVVSAICLLLLSNASNSTGSELLLCNHGSLVASLCSKIRCPAEANPAWRWSFYQPWRDLSLDLTDLQKMDERVACQKLLVIFANALEGKRLELPDLNIENSGLFTWGR
ncbi:PREDICTED: uncharacterized protein LOC104612823 [Nelumbo nucifera]|uniref:Uncharacterized protein LOC104612823 n=1 Tax=Nelumbo nucifera TaxID=4432 RepID=A0A1U8BFA6_NELNU|nr:PREDICTED: uncharacterized protein LOC104612823 [Nelumbo nucifera]